MNDDLRFITEAPVFPTSTPYNALPEFVKVNNNVTETTTAAVISATCLTCSDPAKNAIVDWVWVELRSSPTTVVATRSALLQRDGDIVDMDGTSDVQFPDTYEGSYYLMIRHRNHLAVMTSAAVSYVGGSPMKDFATMTDAEIFTTVPAPAGGYAPRKLLETGVYGLWAGNAKTKNLDDWLIKYNGTNNDRSAILNRVGSTTPLNVVSGYYLEDVNLNGQVKYSGSNNDRVIILNNIGPADPTQVITQQPNN